MAVYRSKVDWWLAALLLFAMAQCAWISVRAVMHGSPYAWLLLLLAGGIVVAMPLWLFLTTTYTIDGTVLYVRSGPVTWRVPLASINTITPTQTLWASPAWSLDRLRIDYGRGHSIVISPRNKEQFLREIDEARRNAA